MSTFQPPRAYPLTLAPLEGRDIDGVGVFCRVQTASGALKIGFDNGGTFLTSAGRAYQAIGDPFLRVRVENPSDTTPITLIVLIGQVIEYDNTLQIVGSTAGLALDGTDATGVIALAGGAGIRGWLSSIAEALRPTKNTEWTPTQLAVPVPAAGTPVRLSIADAFVDQLDIRANAANAGVIKYGFVAGAGNQLWELQPSEWRGVKAPAGKRINLKNVWIDAAINGDGVVFEAHV